ncbi:MULTISPECIES: hypothetical protein [unclassified Amycolatopsis]|uniref:hypothetical protein n=1 Tax=unclassified Amycolatopsis TaxID=2618356 RepID=UPI001C69DA26|nr:hypothetical protein [Amycolatopsis sp. DSM 110486]QYN20299.1 hypothetical protein K1T34_48565 [Amycolatopsis sp. DSM 110486]
MTDLDVAWITELSVAPAESAAKRSRGVRRLRHPSAARRHRVRGADRCLLIYTPGLQSVFDLAPRPAWVCAMLLPMPVLVWGADEIFRRATHRRLGRLPHAG